MFAPFIGAIEKTWTCCGAWPVRNSWRTCVLTNVCSAATHHHLDTRCSCGRLGSAHDARYFTKAVTKIVVAALFVRAGTLARNALMLM
jgi:hypothetical protein